jgi:hypothetical protein
MTARTLPFPSPDPRSPEQLHDQVMVCGTGVLHALETQDADGKGLEWARRLAEIASRAEQWCIAWENERRKASTST